MVTRFIKWVARRHITDAYQRGMSVARAPVTRPVELTRSNGDNVEHIFLANGDTFSISVGGREGYQADDTFQPITLYMKVGSSITDSGGQVFKRCS